MNNNRITLPEPPKVLKSIQNGFDATTKHLVLLLFPIGIDLVLWFGPHLRLKSIIEGLLREMNQVYAVLPPEFNEAVQAGQEIWTVAAERINLVAALRSFPVGIFSLFISIFPVSHPFGEPAFFDLPSAGYAFLVSIGIFLAGLALGVIYFSGVRQAAVHDEVRWLAVLRDWPRLASQSALLSGFWLVFFLAILVFGSCAATGFTIVSIPLGQIVIIMVAVVSFWLVFPLFFSPHGIFSGGQRAWKAILTSVRLTNLTFMRTSTFIFAALVLNQGLNIIWQIPPEDSWLMMISIIGHAFVTTGMLAASFVYYQEMNRWADELQALNFPRTGGVDQAEMEN